MSEAPARSLRALGFSLPELTILVVGLAFAATFGVPRFMSSVERTRSVESFRFGEQLVAAERAHKERTGSFTTRFADLDLELPPLTHFSLSGILSNDLRSEWTVKLTRTGAYGGFGCYVVVFDQDGFNQDRSTIPPAIVPHD